MTKNFKELLALTKAMQKLGVASFKVLPSESGDPDSCELEVKFHESKQPMRTSLATPQLSPDPSVVQLTPEQEAEQLLFWSSSNKGF